MWIRRLRNIFFLNDESLSKRTYDDHTIDIADKEPDDLNELGDVGRGLKESDDTSIIGVTVTNKIWDTCGQEPTVTTRPARKIKKGCTSDGLLLIATYCYFVLFLLCKAGMVFILTEVIYLSKVPAFLWLLSMFPYVLLSAVYYLQD